MLKRISANLHGAIVRRARVMDSIGRQNMFNIMSTTIKIGLTTGENVRPVSGTHLLDER